MGEILLEVSIRFGALKAVKPKSSEGHIRVLQSDFDACYDRDAPLFF